MNDSNQPATAGAGDPPAPAPGFDAPPADDEAPGVSGPGPFPEDHSPRGMAELAEEAEGGPPMPVAKALLVWLVALVLFGVGGFLLGEQELALLAALSGIFVTAQAADESRSWREVYFFLGWVVPALGFVLSIAIGMTVWRGDLDFPLRAGLAVVCSLAAGASILTVPSPIGDALARALFRVPRTGHVLRLTARAIVIGLMLAIPAWFVTQALLEDLLAQPGALMDQVGLGGGLIGYVLLAFAGVGWLVRRGFRESAARLGLVRPDVRSLLVAGLALGALWVLNVGSDWIQQHLFPALWASDRRVTEGIASGMGPARIAMLGLSAGIGEEITMRGALQPRLGIVLTSLLFAALHVQYSWFGMLVIFTLGMILGLVRKRTNTTAAILAHVAYDVLAVFTN